jgi:uncharacterized protein DUF3667
MATSCINCKQPADGKFCKHCGYSLTVKRISFSSIVHEVFHTFTHLDKGYLFTLKSLLTRPGHMQREYLEGQRQKHQKPFSYFFINATIGALVAYWVGLAVANLYSSGSEIETKFFKSYFAIAQMVLVPVYALTSWMVWKLVVKTKYNYGEMLVYILYSAGTFLLFVALVNLLRLIFPDFDTTYVEMALLIPYNIITNYNFFRKPLGYILLGTVVTFSINYLLSRGVAWLVMEVVG